MHAKRQEIGDKTLGDIRNAIVKNQSSKKKMTLEQAKAQIKSTDPDKVRAQLSQLLQE